MNSSNPPIRAALAVFRSLPRVSAICGGHHKMASDWLRSNARRDAGDIPRPAYMRALIAEARRAGSTLCADDLVWGVDDDRLAQLQAELRRARAVRPRHRRIAAASDQAASDHVASDQVAAE